MAKKEESKDPWHKDNIEDTLKVRKAHRRDLLNVIQAMDSQFVYEITKLVLERTQEKYKDKSEGVLPDWSLLDEGSQNFDKDLASKVRSKIDEVYSIESKLHPLAGVIKKAHIERNYFNDRLISGLYFEHTEELKRRVGATAEYLAEARGLHQKNLERVSEEMGKHTLADIDREKHKEGIYEFLKERYKFDEEKVEPELMKEHIQELLGAHNIQKLDKELIYRHYKKYHKKAA